LEVDRHKLDLQDDPKVLSPPIVTAPLYGCATAVNVTAYVPQAKLDVRVDAAIVVAGANGGFPLPSGATIHLPALVPMQVVRARQTSGGTTSDWSAPVTVRDHTKDYPAGPPRPEINPPPVYTCGARTGVGNLLVGSNVWIEDEAGHVGSVKGANTQQGVNVAPAYATGNHVRAFTELCGDQSAPSIEYIASPHGAPLLAPGFETMHDGGSQVVLNGLANGAHFTLSRNGIDIGTFLTWGGRHYVDLATPINAAADTFSATQQLCPGDPHSPPGHGAPVPCSKLAAPLVAPVQDGDTQIVLLDFVADATIKVFVNLKKTGEGSGPVIVLTKPVPHNAVIDVWQIVGTCKGSTVQELSAHCVAPPVTFDPSALDIYPVGTHEYDFGTFNAPDLTSNALPLHGSVYYPADDDGDGKPFNTRLKKHGPVPVVVLIHGNHDNSVPNYTGYDYFQAQLARMGIVAFSLDENEQYDEPYGTGNILIRARVAIESIKRFQGLNAGDPILGGTMDFSRLGLMGHSRGAETVMVVPEQIALAGVTIRAVLSLAPTDNHAWTGTPGKYAFMTFLPAADGDVWPNYGAEFYDRGDPQPVKTQLYIDAANHNFFNRQWLNDDAFGVLPLMARADHERILSTYGCALYRTALLGHDLSGFLRGLELPPAVANQNVHLAFDVASRTVVDNYEGHPITANSQGQPNAQSGGITAADFAFHQGGGTFNPSFFGATTGMVASNNDLHGRFRWQLAKTADLTKAEVWLRSAEVWGGKLAAKPVDFRIGVEDANKTLAWVDVNDVGGVPRPFDRTAIDPLNQAMTTKTMLNTFRVPGHCFAAAEPKLAIKKVRAILVELETDMKIPVAFDDVAIVPAV
jgi:hypothetical protein